MPTNHVLNKRLSPKLVSFVFPVYNEEEVLPILKSELERFLPELSMPIELIFVNDGSHDSSLAYLLNWAALDSRVKVLGFARNFGHQAAVTAGLDHAQGDAVIIMDADLQDPLSVVHDMLQKYQDGYDVAYGQRLERKGETWFKKWSAWAFYRIMKRLIHKELPLDTGDFRLLSRECLNVLNELRETHRFLRGMATWIGFAQIGIPYQRQARAAGETKYPLRKMVKFAWTAAVSFSPLPLRLSLGLGIAIAAFGFLAGIYAIIRSIIYFYFSTAGFTYNPGWATLVTLICLIGGANLIGIGILGEYIGRIFEEVKRRPLYVIRTYKNIVEKPYAR